MGCPFCNVNKAKILLENDSFEAINDARPVKPGHLLIITKRHAETVFDLSTDEFSQLHAIIHLAKSYLETHYAPDGYNLGMNCGRVAGQSIPHFHLHLIPRYKDENRIGFKHKVSGKIREYLNEIL